MRRREGGGRTRSEESNHQVEKHSGHGLTMITPRSRKRPSILRCVGMIEGNLTMKRQCGEG